MKHINCSDCGCIFKAITKHPYKYKNGDIGIKITNPPTKCKKCRKLVKRYEHYGLTKDQYEILLSEHNNSCAICKQSVKLVIDHCHTTGQVRGLLCNACNSGLGFFIDDILWLEEAKKYLQKAAKNS